MILNNEVYKTLLNLQDIEGNTAMHLAAENGQNKIMEALLTTESCDVTLKNINERATVHLLSRSGKPSVIILF